MFDIVGRLVNVFRYINCGEVRSIDIDGHCLIPNLDNRVSPSRRQKRSLAIRLYHVTIDSDVSLLLKERSVSGYLAFEKRDATYLELD